MLIYLIELLQNNIVCHVFRIAFRDKKKYVNLAKPSSLCEKLIWFRDNIDNTIEQYTQDTLSSLVEKYVFIIYNINKNMIIGKNNYK